MKEFVERLAIAQNHFDWARNPGEVDAAIYELNAAEQWINNYVKQSRKDEFCDTIIHIDTERHERLPL